MINKKFKSAIYLIAFLALALGIYQSYELYALTKIDQLWGMIPLFVLFWISIGLTLFFGLFRKISDAHWKHYLLALIGGLMLGISFPPFPLLPLVFFGWLILYYLINLKESTAYIFRLAYFQFLIWNIVATYWVCNTALVAGIVAILANSLLMCLPILAFLWLKKYIPNKYTIALFITCWLTFEYCHFRWELHWIWLTVGHYYAATPSLIQWYKYTGVFGGSLQILLLSYCLHQFVMDKINEHKWSRRYLSYFVIIFTFPIIISAISTDKNQVPKHTIKVALVQPNFEPHYVKSVISQRETLQQFLKLSEQIVDDSTDFIIYPETSFSIPLHAWEGNANVGGLQLFLSQHPNLKLIFGLEAFRILDKDEPHNEFTRTVKNNSGNIYWENANTAIEMSYNEEKEIYYKSKLVPGAEFFPFKHIFFFMKPLIDKLGGSGSGLVSQKNREVFGKKEQAEVGPIICYESLFGEYVSEYVSAGAKWLTVMTNDGWWDNTAGHQQHLYYSSLRAIEQNRWIARAANSGVSAFIDQYGQIHQATNYGEEAAISRTIPLLEERTFYSKHGDYIGRLALTLFGIFCLFYVYLRWVKAILEKQNKTISF